MSINVAGFANDSIVDGPGLRFVIFCQGCKHNCPSCHNPQTHAFGVGIDYDTSLILQMIRKNPLCSAVTFSGGEPMEQASSCMQLAARLKRLGYETACYTGYTWEEIIQNGSMEQLDFLLYLDILVDGRFVLALRNLDLRFRGSSNQRIINVRESLMQKDLAPVLSSDRRWIGEKRF